MKRGSLVSKKRINKLQSLVNKMQANLAQAVQAETTDLENRQNFMQTERYS